MFRDKAPPQSQPRPDFYDSDDESTNPSRGAPRREVVHVVLRETMRLHGIPSDWIEARALSLVRSDKTSGTHVTLIVRGGEDRLLPYVLAFQASFQEALARFDPRADDWLRGIAWQFDARAAPTDKAMPDPRTWSGALPRGKAPAVAAVAAVAAKPQDIAASDDEDLKRDLMALFAIRDAALRPQGDDIQQDFQPTRTDTR